MVNLILHSLHLLVVSHAYVVTRLCHARGAWIRRGARALRIQRRHAQAAVLTSVHACMHALSQHEQLRVQPAAWLLKS